MEVLIVDNSAAIISRFTEMLSELDAIKKIYTASSCEETLASIKKNHPGILIIDINIPGMDSVQCLTAIKKHYKHTIIALANKDDKTDMKQCRQLRVHHILDKYHEFEKVPEIILSIVKKNS